MRLHVQDLSELFPVNQGEATDQITLSAVMTDTRKKAKQSLFIPIVGDNFDGHDFLGEAIEQGAVATLWQQGKELPKLVPTDFPVFFVEDTVKGLQQLAKAYLKRIAPIVVGVTGSNGKTTTKDLMAAVLGMKYKTHKTQGNFNNHIGLPLTILQMENDTEAVVLEMGMDRAGEISLLSNLAEPDYAVITNIGESHIENFESREGIAQAKLEITDGLKSDGFCALDGDEPLLLKAKERANTRSCGFGDDCQYRVRPCELGEDHSVFEIDKQRFTLPMAGKHNIKNAVLVYVVAEQLGLTHDQIQAGFKQVKVSGMRFEKVEGKNGSLIINDAYNASPTSMKAVIEVVRNMTSKSKKVLVLGDMYELGPTSPDLHATVADVINHEIDVTYTIGKDSEAIHHALKQKDPHHTCYHFTDKQELGLQVEKELNEDTVVLIKASRGMKLEEIVEALVD